MEIGGIKITDGRIEMIETKIHTTVRIIIIEEEATTTIEIRITEEEIDLKRKT